MFINKVLAAVVALSLMAALPAADHDHDHDHAHEEHASEGKVREVGDVTISNVTYGVSVHGDIKAGKEAVLSIDVEKGKGANELRVWVGVKNGKGSVKALLKADDHGDFHGHLEVPATLPKDSAIWLEVATDDGRERGSVSLPAAGTEDEGDDHEGHDHKGDNHEGDDHEGHNHD